MPPFASFGPSPFSSPAPMASADFSPHRFRGVAFRTQGETSPGKTAALVRTTAGFTLTGLGRKSFAGTCLLARPCTPPIRFLSVSPRIRFTLLPAPISRWNPCASRGSLRPGLRRGIDICGVTNRYSKVPLVWFETRDVMRDRFDFFWKNLFQNVIASPPGLGAQSG